MMSQPWESPESLAGVMGNMNLADHGKPGPVAAARGGFYPSQGLAHADYGLPFQTAGVASLGLEAIEAAAYASMPAYSNGYTGYHHPAAAGVVQIPASAGTEREVYSGVGGEGAAFAGMPNLGWGGQAIQDASGFKAPWFGKTRGRGGTTSGQHGQRGRQSAQNRSGGARNGRGNGRGTGNGYVTNGASGGAGRGGRRNGGDSPNQGAGPEEASVDAVTTLVSSIPASQPLSDPVHQALFQLQGRSCAMVLKELARSGMHRRAAELFDYIRALDAGHPLQSLLDVFSYTAAISLCISSHDVERALALAAEMKVRGVPRNVHTYTALMNVCIKCSKYELALQTYHSMRAERCVPNVVTFNTLIDVFGKMGAWEQAVDVLGVMKAEGVEPVLRTYNTLLIACNMCSQPREAVGVYRRMLDEGFAPNSTTYNALISAYGKAGQLDRVMEVFQEMLYRGCERNVITYSSLISACEKAGRWELALELFHEMVRERCSPNTVTFNSLITALGQGAQWERAEEVFAEMQSQGCTPDVVTYTALISAMEKGGQWRRALAAFERMRMQGCRADAIVYNAIIDTLWETGAVWAQRKALAVFKTSVAEGHFGQARLVPHLPLAEVNLHAMTAGVAMLSLYAWLMSLKAVLTTHGAGAAPARLSIVTDRGRGAKEQGNLVVKEAVAAMMAWWGAPFKPLGEGGASGTLEATGADMAAWLLSGAFEASVFAIFPCTDMLPSVAGSNRSLAGLAGVAARLDDPDNHKEASVEQRCSDAFAAVRLFEKTHCLTLQNMGFAYLHRRAELVARCADVAASLGAKPEAGHDAVLLMDRVMSTSCTIAPDLLDLLATACVVIAAEQVDGPGAAPSFVNSSLSAGLPPQAVEQMAWNVRHVLGQDTAAISTLRCLKLYLERLGGHHLEAGDAGSLAGGALGIVGECLAEMSFLNCRPSVIAAAVMYTDRRSRGVIPFWPTTLAKLTGYADMSTPELSVAIKAAQRTVGKVANAGGGSSSSSSEAGGASSGGASSRAGSLSAPRSGSPPSPRPSHTVFSAADLVGARSPGVPSVFSTSSLASAGMMSASSGGTMQSVVDAHALMLALGKEAAAAGLAPANGAAALRRSPSPLAHLDPATLAQFAGVSTPPGPVPLQVVQGSTPSSGSDHSSDPAPVPQPCQTQSSKGPPSPGPMLTISHLSEMNEVKISPPR